MAKQNATKKVLLSQPKDRSLEAFKEWISEISSHLLGEGYKSTMTEEKWKEQWEAFWKKAG